MSVAALARTVDPARRLHSLHAYFLRFGRHGTPIRFAVDRVRDGGSYSTRRVEASQEDAAIFVATASFCLPEEGISHQDRAARGAASRRSAGSRRAARAHRRPAQPQPRGRGADVRSASVRRHRAAAGPPAAVDPPARSAARRSAGARGGARLRQRHRVHVDPQPAPSRCGGASARRRASTTRSGSTGRRATTTGSSTPRRARRRTPGAA